MNSARPRSVAGRLGLWALLLALACLPLLARRPWAAWRADLAQEDGGRRVLAARALAEVPDELVPGAMSALARSAEEVDAEVAAAAKLSLRRLAPRSGRVLAQTVERGESPQREQALELLGLGGPEVVHALVEVLLGSADSAARLRGLEILEVLGPDARSAAADIERLGADPDPALRRQALRTLQRVHQEGPELFRLAQRLTGDADPGVRQRAWRLLAISPRLLERARDPRFAPGLAEALARELPALPRALQEALEEGLSKER